MLEPPAPKPRPKKKKAPRRTELIEVAEQEPVVGWLVGLQGPFKGRQFRLKPGRTSIGSHPECAIVLDNPYVSGRHANLTHVHKDGEDIFILADLDSNNGTYLNGNRDEPVQRVELVDSDRVEFGELAFKFKCV